MAEKLSLRDYQRDLAERLRAASTARAASLLALQVGQEGWLVDLADAGEVIPVPAITPVPLTRGWFRGMANIRASASAARCSWTARSGCAIRRSSRRSRAPNPPSRG
jgi:hypothetical protein